MERNTIPFSFLSTLLLMFFFVGCSADKNSDVEAEIIAKDAVNDGTSYTTYNYTIAAEETEKECTAEDVSVIMKIQTCDLVSGLEAFCETTDTVEFGNIKQGKREVKEVAFTANSEVQKISIFRVSSSDHKDCNAQLLGISGS